MLLSLNSEFDCGTKLTFPKRYVSKLLLWSNLNSVTIYLVSVFGNFSKFRGKHLCQTLFFMATSGDNKNMTSCVNRTFTLFSKKNKFTNLLIFSIKNF